MTVIWNNKAGMVINITKSWQHWFIMSNSDIKLQNWRKQCQGFRSSLSTINSVKRGFALSWVSLSRSCQSPPRWKWLQHVCRRGPQSSAPLALITPISALATTRPSLCLKCMLIMQIINWAGAWGFVFMLGLELITVSSYVLSLTYDK